MSRDNKVQMPTSTAGITRFFDESKSKISFKPGHVIALSVIIMFIILLLHAYGNRILGI